MRMLMCLGEVTNPVYVRKRPKEKPPKEAPPPKKASAIITEVETIISDLKEKHGSKYDAAKYACWAHCINSGRHGSLEEPPDLPFFTGRKKVAVSVLVP